MMLPCRAMTSELFGHRQTLFKAVAWQMGDPQDAPLHSLAKAIAREEDAFCALCDLECSLEERA
eukprot:7909562-Prorocentrum_lima.AAC.1